MRATLVHPAQKRLYAQCAHLARHPFGGQCQGIDQVRQAPQIVVALHRVPGKYLCINFQVQFYLSILTRVWSAVRYIALSEEERITLGELFKNHWNARQRMRAHALVLSDRRFEINDIANIYLVDRDTVCSWLDHWEQLGIVGLQDDPRPGRPQKLRPEEQVRVRPGFRKGGHTQSKFLCFHRGLAR
jgi:Winged helix-turn helix